MSDMVDAMAYAPRCVQVLHERDGRCLAKYECNGGTTIMYGVHEAGEIVFLGTKAEAKKVYGNWRKGT